MLVAYFLPCTCQGFRQPYCSPFLPLDREESGVKGALGLGCAQVIREGRKTQGGECLVERPGVENVLSHKGPRRWQVPPGPCREAAVVSGSSGGTAPALRGKKLAKFGENKQKLEHQGVGMIRIHWKNTGSHRA